MDRKKFISKTGKIFLGFLILLFLKTPKAIPYACDADINGDGKVDFIDVEIMRTEMNRVDCRLVDCQTDLNGDGQVNDKDKEILKAELGRDDCSPGNGGVPREGIDITQPGQDTEFETGDEKNSDEGHSPSTTRFKDNGDGTVTDPKTGLIWTKDANLPVDTMLFHQALDYIDEMNEGKNPNLGYTDWRLPTPYELRSLIDYTQYIKAGGHELPSNHPFINVKPLKFNMNNDWSASSYLFNTDFPRFISFYCKLVGHNVKSCYGYLWPVRGGQ